MNDITSHYKRRDALMRTSLLAMFGSLLFLVVVPFIMPQPAAEPIEKFKPYRALDTMQASVRHSPM
jgi:hypothetical protein